MGTESLKLAQMSAELMLMSVVILSIVMLCLQIIGFLESPISLTKTDYFVIVTVALAESLGIVCFACGDSRWRQCLLGIFAGSLLVACVTDALFCKVYNFVWWIGLGAAAGLFWDYISNVDEWFAACIIIRNLVFFVAVQFIVFRKLYGRADVYAFVVCSLTGVVFGLGIIGFFCHMLMAWMLLAVVQIVRKNVGRDGNLKRPVAFIPYITLAFWIIIVYIQT